MKIPTFEEVMQKQGNERTALEEFVFDFEPAEEHEQEEFRRKLQNLVEELTSESEECGRE